MNWWEWVFSGVGVLALGLIIQWWRRRSPSGHDAAITAQGARVSDSPVASGTDIIQTVGGTHHHYYPAAVGAQQPAVVPESTPEPQRRADESANLSPLHAREVLVHLNSGVWHEASTDLSRARRAIVLPFKNVPKPPGQHTQRASGVSASLVFKNADNSDGMHINHGVWLGIYEYPATFNPGVTYELLVALKDVPFVTLENPNATNPFARRRFRSGMVIYSPQMKIIWKEGTVEIVLVDGQNVTLFHGMFEYQLSVEKMVVCPR